jgi:hypothetical protein
MQERISGATKSCIHRVLGSQETNRAKRSNIRLDVTKQESRLEFKAHITWDEEKFIKEAKRQLRLPTMCV